MNVTEPLLSAACIAVGYGDIQVVWDISFEVRAGEITALLGRNGAGKTTSLRAVAGLNALMGGTITYDGQILDRRWATDKRIRHGIGYVQEGKRVFRGQSVADNLLMGGYSLGLRRRAVQREVETIYELFPALRDKRRQLAGSLSGGQQQMVAIGQALMAKPRLLMLDEPSGGLAPAVVAEVMDRIALLKESGLAILLVEQAVEAAMGIADRIAVLDVGRVMMTSAVSEITDVERVKDMCMGR
jgi:branched-chain amino acid transport system ATP-binding protein